MALWHLDDVDTRPTWLTQSPSGALFGRCRLYGAGSFAAESMASPIR